MGVRAETAEPGEEDDGYGAQGRIPFLLRIGVTGHRKLPEGEELLKAVKHAVDLAVSCSEYPSEGRHTPLKLTAVSSLAEGADRLVASEVLNRNGSLICVLPVTTKDKGIEVYRADFESEKSRQEFDDLRGRARQEIEPPEDLQSQPREDGYRWAGQEVARHSDVIIVIWDGLPSRRVGGTADLIRWLRDHDQEERPELGPEEPGPEEWAPLRIIVHTGADHAPYVSVDDAPPYDVAAEAARSRLSRNWPELDKFNRKEFKATTWQRWTKQMMGELAPADYQQSPRLNGLLKQITPPLIRADQRAIATQRKFRWFSYTLYGFTALATIFAALQAVVLTGTWGLTVVELVLLVLSIVILAMEKKRNYNHDWMVYRFLAERLRTAFYLLAAGRVPDVDSDVGGTKEVTQNDWVRRAFIEILAEGDRVHEHTPEDPETLSTLIRKHWMAGQLGYFERTSKKMARRHRGVVWIISGVLVTTIVAALLHSLRIWSLHSGATEALIMCAIGLPAVAGALSSVRGLRQFRRHQFRYARMAAVIQWYLRKESSADDIGSLAEKVGNLLTAETRGWLVEISSDKLEP